MSTSHSIVGVPSEPRDAFAPPAMPPVTPRWSWRVAGGALLLGAIVVWLAGPWLHVLRTFVPEDDAPDDAWLIVWVLDWVHHAITTAPRMLFDPPVNHPAPHQLAGSEHFLAEQVLFTPLRWLTGSTIVAANLTTLLSYALAAVVMDVLLIELGIGTTAAWLGGLVYGFGAAMAPARAHVLQVPHVFLPLVALALRRVREHPSAGRGVAFALALGAGLTSSFHMAVYLSLATAVWATAELLRRADGRTRFTVVAGVAAFAAVALLAVTALPYLARPEAQGDLELVLSPYRTTHLEPGHLDDYAQGTSLAGFASGYVGCLLGGGYPFACSPIELLVSTWVTLPRRIPPVVPLTMVLTAIGVAGAWRVRSQRHVVVVGAALVLLGFLLGGAAYCRIAGVDVPLLRALLAATPARFIRAPQRSRVVSFFGATLVLAVGLHVLLAYLRPRTRRLLVPMLAASIVLRPPDEWPASLGAMRAWHTAALYGRLAPVRFLTNPAVTDPAPYQLVARKMHSSDGPLLELPDTRDGTTVVSQSMLRNPSVSFYTGYLPPHQHFVAQMIGLLPDPAALDDLVDMTGLRWILLRPENAWPNPARRRWLLTRLRTLPRVRRTMHVGAFTLVELDSTSYHPQWFRGIAAGAQRGRSALGTPLVPIPARPERATIEATVPTSAPAGRAMRLHVDVTNRGNEPWAAALRPDTPLTVRLELRWLGPGTSAREAGRDAFPLLRDLPGGEKRGQQLLVGTPATPGVYRLEIAVRQVAGNALASALNPIVRAVRIDPPANVPGPTPPPAADGQG